KQVGMLQVEYEKYLSELLRKNGFSADTLITTRPPDRRSAPGLAKGKEPVYERLVFTVAGKARLENLTRALEEFYQTNLLHQVRSMTVQAPQNRGQRGIPGQRPGAGGPGAGGLGAGAGAGVIPFAGAGAFAGMGEFAGMGQPGAAPGAGAEGV